MASVIYIENQASSGIKAYRSKVFEQMKTKNSPVLCAGESLCKKMTPLLSVKLLHRVAERIQKIAGRPTYTSLDSVQELAQDINEAGKQVLQGLRPSFPPAGIMNCIAACPGYTQMPPCMLRFIVPVSACKEVHRSLALLVSRDGEPTPSSETSIERQVASLLAN